jgi:hypothetical protein
MLVGCGSRYVDELQPAVVDSTVMEVIDDDHATPPETFVETFIVDATGVDTSVMDVREEATAFDAAAPCAPIAGTGPTSADLRGTIAFDDPALAPASVQAWLFLPKGRVAGAPVYLARNKTRRPGWDVAKATLDATLSAKLDVRDENCGDAIHATLAGPSDGLIARVDYNSNPESDFVVLKPGSAKLCSVGTIPAPTLAVSSSVLMHSPLDIPFTVPLDESTVSTVKLSEPATLKIVLGHLRFDPINAWNSITIDASGLRDLLGRPFATTTTSVGITRPAEGAVPLDYWGGGASFGGLADGSVYAQPEKNATQFTFTGILRPSTGSTKLRIRHRFLCGMASPGARVVAMILARSGAVTPLTTKCSESFVEEVVTLPAETAYLWAEGEIDPPRPCWTPSIIQLPRYEAQKLVYEP